MKDEEFVKLSAIERMAKPMSEFHKGEDSYEEEEYDDEMVECPKCGCKFEIED